MRRWMVISMLCVILLVSCAKQEVTPVTNDFSCRVDLVYNEQEASGVLTCSSDGVTELTFDSPTALRDVIMRWDGHEVSLQYGGMSLALEQDRIPVGAAVKVICRTLKACGDSSISLQNTTIKGESDVGEYTVTFDANAGFPLMLSCPQLGLSVRFYDCQRA